MTCEQIDELLAAYSVGAIERDEDAAVRAHLAGCRQHDAALAGLAPVVERLALLSEEREPPAGLRSRLLQAFDAEATGGRVTALPIARRPSVGGRGPFALLAAAALVLAVVGLTVWNVVLQTGGDDGGMMVVQLVGDTGSGELIYVPDEQMVMIKIDLPALPGDRAYQAWRVDDGEMASLGMVPSSGIMAMDADLSGAAAVAISEEPAAGSDHPTSPPLMSADLP